jgi:uncharacterized RDD family membrane protein YckC
MDAPRAFNYIFDDRNWFRKLLIGLIVSIVPIINFAWAGYIIQLLSNVSLGLETPLPEWSDFGKKFVDGLIIAVVVFIYALPVTILITAAMGGIGLFEFVLQADLSDWYSAALTGLSSLLSCLVLAYLLALTFFFPAVTLHYSRQDNFGACFQIGRIFNLITNNRDDYLQAWVVSLVTWLVIIFFASFTVPLLVATCCLIPLALAFVGFTAVWPATVYAHLFGQVGAAQLENGE